MQGLFSSQILADKLAKLNSTQQSIETLSHWCIFHRRSAKQVVDVWEREFFRVPREQRVPFLYLANDILQNSRRKGAEFVTEFWRVLSGALKDVMKYGDESNRSAVLRLIDIWEERRVFGSHAQGLREELLGKDSPLSINDVNMSNAFMPEKLVAVYKTFHDKLSEEEEVIEKCNTAVFHMETFEKEIDIPAISGQGQESTAILIEELQHQEGILVECAENLEAIGIARSGIVFQLQEALRDQEAELEKIRVLQQAAHSHAEQARMMQQQILALQNGGGSDVPIPIPPYENHSTDAECYVPTEKVPPPPISAVLSSLAVDNAKVPQPSISSVLSSLAVDKKVADDEEQIQPKRQKVGEDPVEGTVVTTATATGETTPAGGYLDPAMLLPFNFGGQFTLPAATQSESYATSSSLSFLRQ